MPFQDGDTAVRVSRPARAVAPEAPGIPRWRRWCRVLDDKARDSIGGAGSEEPRNLCPIECATIDN